MLPLPGQAPPRPSVLGEPDEEFCLSRGLELYSVAKSCVGLSFNKFINMGWFLVLLAGEEVGGGVWWG